jgi:hypothetical protein
MLFAYQIKLNQDVQCRFSGPRPKSRGMAIVTAPPSFDRCTEPKTIRRRQPPKVKSRRKYQHYPEENQRFGWQEWQGSNLQPPVLETGALPIELHS